MLVPMDHGRPPLPTEQHTYEGLAHLTPAQAHLRRERVFLVLAGLFLGTLAMLNILGITRFIKLFSIDFDGDPATGATVFAVAVGVLPYPITFLCTDFISELFGRRRANQVVWVGLVLNIWVMAILWLGGALPGAGPAADPALTEAVRFTVESIQDPGVRDAVSSAVARPPVYFEVRALAFGAVTASMIAYLAAQFIDVQLFHFWKRLTRNRHLWLRNNGSTLISQLVDTIAVILITHFVAGALAISPDTSLATQLLVYIATGYLFKLVIALLDTIPFYVGAHWLSRYLRLPPPAGRPHPPAAAAVEAGVG
jgi:uncharacterized PurR-regulated membrane protein YhhQ (DUF165 family)